MHTHMHIIHIYTFRYTGISHTYIYMHTYTYVNTCINIQTCISCTHTNIQAHKHITHIHIHKHAGIHTHAYTHAHHAHVYTFRYTHISHTCIHTHAHIHICKRTYINLPLCMLGHSSPWSSGQGEDQKCKLMNPKGPRKPDLHPANLCLSHAYGPSSFYCRAHFGLQLLILEPVTVAARRCVVRINFIINFIFLNMGFMNLAITCNFRQFPRQLMSSWGTPFSKDKWAALDTWSNPRIYTFHTRCGQCISQSCSLPIFCIFDIWNCICLKPGRKQVSRKAWKHVIMCTTHDHPFKTCDWDIKFL